jgi:ankyrin repeat protein
LQYGRSVYEPAEHFLEKTNRMPDSAQEILFARSGNVRGLEDLFKQRLASPRAVSTTRGYTLLRWALYARQSEMVEYLASSSDPDYPPIAASDNSPRIKACHFMLEGGLSERAIEILNRCLILHDWFLDDFIESSRFTLTHRIVLGLASQDLSEETTLSPQDINAQDKMGRTPLAWAAARGDLQSVTTLISHGGDPTMLDVQISGPLSNAAAQGHTDCVKLLLAAGANPDSSLPKGVKKGSPLSIAVRKTKDTTLVELLLDCGANPNNRNTEDETPLFHAARNNNASFTTLLLDAGAV